jgi:exodeoxyribonuclease VIII
MEKPAMIKGTHLMIDLETFGTKPDAPIVSIGAAVFDLETGVYKKFERLIDLDSALKYGKPSGSTLEWWFRQDQKAISKTILSKSRDQLPQAILDLQEFIKENSPKVVWAKSPAFDIRILENAFDAVGLTLPVQYWKCADVRTIEKLAPSVYKQAIAEYENQSKAIAHTALADCYRQVVGIKAVFDHLFA